MTHTKAGSAKKNIRVKKGIYRKYLQEYIPLFYYALTSYGIYKEIKIAGNMNNDNFDGRILENGVEIEKIELSFPIEGKRENEEAKQLNEKGISNVYEFSTTKESAYLDLVFLKAEEKSTKDYSESTLIITLDLWPYFSLDDIDDMSTIYDFRDRLKTLKYIAKKVILFIPPCNSTEINTLGIIMNVYKS